VHDDALEFQGRAERVQETGDARGGRGFRVARTPATDLAEHRPGEVGSDDRPVRGQRPDHVEPPRRSGTHRVDQQLVWSRRRRAGPQIVDVHSVDYGRVAVDRGPAG
jgi:hypothetical protein